MIILFLSLVLYNFHTLKLTSYQTMVYSRVSFKKYLIWNHIFNTGLCLAQAALRAPPVFRFSAHSLSVASHFQFIKEIVPYF